MARKKRKMIIVIGVISALLFAALVTTLILLYLRTDMFKSNQQLFTKYIGKNVENLGTIYKTIGKSEYQESLQQSKYAMSTEMKINYTENIKTSSESTQNSINQLRLKINSQVDKNNQYNYQDINLINNNDKAMEIEYLQNQGMQSIRFTDLFTQFVSSEDGNLLETYKNLENSEEISKYIPDETEFDIDFKNLFEFTEEEKQTIIEKYSGILNNKLSNDKFSKQTNQDIQINNQNIKANAYILKLTKEQLNNIFIEILEELKQDETILSKLDNLEEVFSTYKISDISLRNEFTDNLDEKISQIMKNNIGQDESQIIVYESEGQTVKTVIQSPDYEITIEMLPNSQNAYMQILYKDITEENEQKQVFTYEKTDEGTDVTFENTVDGVTTQYTISIVEKVDGKHCDKDISIKYEDNSNRVEATVAQSIDIVSDFTNTVTLNDENNINLNNLDEESAKAVLETVTTGVEGKINEITTNVINMEDFSKILKAIGVIQERETIESAGITETEKTRFNSQFEILQGEKLESDNMLNLVNAIKGNLISVEAISSNQIELKLDRLNNNEQAINTLSTFIEKNKDYKYDVKVVYNEETGLANSILLTVYEK